MTSIPLRKEVEEVGEEEKGLFSRGTDGELEGRTRAEVSLDFIDWLNFGPRVAESGRAGGESGCVLG